MKKINDKKAARIFKLFEERTRCLILARHGYVGVNDWGRYFEKSLELDDKIIEELFGTSDLVALGSKWGLLKYPKKFASEEEPKKKVSKRRKKKKRD